MNFNLINIILIIAATQGLLLQFLIFKKHKALFANKYLATLMLCYTIILIHLLLDDIGFYRSFPFTALFSGLTLAAMPLHFLYTKHLIQRSQYFKRTDLYHFIPFLLFEIVLFLIILVELQKSLSINFNVLETDCLLEIFSSTIIIQGIIYLGLSLRMIKKYNDNVKNVLSSIEQVQLTWLRNITFAGIFAISIYLIEYIFHLGGVNISGFIISSVCFAAYVYGMGYVGLLKSEIFADPIIKKNMAEIETVEISRNEKELRKYERSGLSQELAEKHLNHLINIMNDEKLYLNSSLTLTDLAEKLSISTHNLSEIINTRLNKNFYDFINGYRINQAKIDLLDPSKKNLKILSIAFDAGFNSKTTFNTLFKEYTGKTPSEFRSNPSFV